VAIKSSGTAMGRAKMQLKISINRKTIFLASYIIIKPVKIN